MKELKFVPELLEAIRHDEKTVTRRPIKPQPQSDSVVSEADCPYGIPGTVHRLADDLSIRITRIDVEELQEIGAYDAIMEGFDPSQSTMESDDPWESFLAGFAEFWDSIYAEKGFGWSVDPWVWVIRFEKTKKGS